MALMLLGNAFHSLGPAELKDELWTKVVLHLTIGMSWFAADLRGLL